MYTAFAENRSKIPPEPLIQHCPVTEFARLRCVTEHTKFCFSTGWEAVVGLSGSRCYCQAEAGGAAGRKVRVLIIVDDCGPLQQELVHISLDGQRHHGMSSIPWSKAFCGSSDP